MERNQFRLARGDESFIDRYLLQFASEHDVESVAGTVRSNASWMVGNTVLALIPLAIALWITRHPRSPAWMRWPAIAAFVALLPNALYVVTDLIHLAYEGDQLGWSTGVWFVLVPIYAVFVAIGLASYAVCLQLTIDWTQRRGADRSTAITIVVLLNLACACGVYLGRVVRLNSWDFFVDLPAVGAGIVTLMTRSEALAYVATMALIGGINWVVAPRLGKHLGWMRILRLART